MFLIIDLICEIICKKRLLQCLVILLFLFSNKIIAKEIVLFSEDSKAVKNYNKAREEIMPGDTLVFSKNKKFKVDQLLGCGNTSCIYELANFPGQVLRIPKNSGLYFFTQRSTYYYEDYIQEFANGKSLLNKYGIPSAQVYEDQKNEFVRVEKINSFTDLRQFLANPFLYSKSDRFKMEEDLVEFAKTVSPLKTIGDFYSDQLHYIKGRGWVLLDWTNGHKLYDLKHGPRHSKNPFDNLFEYETKRKSALKKTIRNQIWIRSLKKRINESIANERERSSRLIQNENCLFYYSQLPV